jgi:hypothetical protein
MFLVAEDPGQRRGPAEWAVGGRRMAGGGVGEGELPERVAAGGDIAGGGGQGRDRIDDGAPGEVGSGVGTVEGLAPAEQVIEGEAVVARRQRRIDDGDAVTAGLAMFDEASLDGADIVGREDRRRLDAQRRRQRRRRHGGTRAERAGVRRRRRRRRIAGQRRQRWNDGVGYGEGGRLAGDLEAPEAETHGLVGAAEQVGGPQHGDAVAAAGEVAASVVEKARGRVGPAGAAEVKEAEANEPREGIDRAVAGRPRQRQVEIGEGFD